MLEHTIFSHKTGFRVIRTEVLCSSLLFATLFLSCGKDDPAPEEKGKVITDVNLVFNPVAGGVPLSFSATDPDDEGPEDLVPETIVLPSGQSFQLFIRVRNDMESEDLTELIADEANDHLFFFAFTDAVFDQPTGDGNIDNRSDPVNYIDEDDVGLPLGLITGWQTGDPGSGTLRIILSHQPEMKNMESESNIGIKDFDITFDINIE